MDIRKVKKLIELIEESDVEELEIKGRRRFSQNQSPPGRSCPRGPGSRTDASAPAATPAGKQWR